MVSYNENRQLDNYSTGNSHVGSNICSFVGIYSTLKFLGCVQFLIDFK